MVEFLILNISEGLLKKKNISEGLRSEPIMLLERPRVVSEQVGHAWDLPDNKFGAAYARVMGPRNFSPFRP
ncbi:unnamed protein product [Brassica rapa]|uniref:Uncharacterized protein n=1 Tax=Brassica campestris TaxID=3711 RepID=A0A8D9FZ90_BRACM|nr:unnamed protein product [Brassica rapa]